MDAVHANATTLAAELDWFERVLETRIALHFEQPAAVDDIHALTPPDLGDEFFGLGGGDAVGHKAIK
jgi:hypothetical protein